MKAPLRRVSMMRLVLASFFGSTCFMHAGTVTTANDDPTPGSGSLRALLATAVNGELIDFDSSLNGATISLTNGQLPISGLEVTIDASALQNGIALNGNNASRILNISSGSNVTLKNLTFHHGREANGNSGAIQAQGGQLTMSRCIIRDCFAKFDGGGIHVGSGIVANFEDCSLTRNESQSYGGGLFIIGTTNVTLTNTAITGNRSLFGGGVFALGGGVNFTNCTVQGNAGAGLYGESSSNFFVRNSIIWGNRTGSGGLSIQQLRLGPNASSNVDYSLIEGISATLNNLNGTLLANDPLFVTPAVPANAPNTNADVRLKATSTSINAGSNAVVIQALDLAGAPRIQDGQVDLGAFEGGYVTFSSLHPSLAINGDENQNGISNYVEYALGVDPTGSSAHSALPAMSTNGGFNYLTLSQRINGLDVNGVWTTSTTLDALSWQLMMLGTDYSPESNSLIAPGRQQFVLKLLSSDPARFYRQRFSTTN